MSDDSIRVREGVEIPAWEIWFTASRSGGPGGQHVNKTSSRVTLHWDVVHSSALSGVHKVLIRRKLAGRIDADGVLTLSVDSERSQLRNKQIAVERLVDLLREALTPRKRRVPTKATKASKRKRLDAKSRRGSLKMERRKPGVDD